MLHNLFKSKLSAISNSESLGGKIQSFYIRTNELCIALSINLLLCAWCHTEALWGAGCSTRIKGWFFETCWNWSVETLNGFFDKGERESLPRGYFSTQGSPSRLPIFLYFFLFQSLFLDENFINLKLISHEKGKNNISK